MEIEWAQSNVAMSSGSSARSLEASRNAPHDRNTPPDFGTADVLAIWDAIAVDYPTVGKRADVEWPSGLMSGVARITLM